MDVPGVHDPREPVHPRDRHVEHVPHQRERPAGGQQPHDLRRRRRGVEPVPGLGDSDELSGRSRKAGRLGRGEMGAEMPCGRADCSRLRRRAAAQRGLEHGGAGVHRSDVEASVHERPGQLPGAGTQVDRTRRITGGSGRHLCEDRLENGVRITGAQAIVVLALLLEGGGERTLPLGAAEAGRVARGERGDRRVQRIRHGPEPTAVGLQRCARCATQERCRPA